MDFTATFISQSFTYLQSVYALLNHAPRHPWTHGTIEPSALLYLLQDNPEIQLWDYKDHGLQHISWIREPDIECSLQDAMNAVLARWHVGHKNGEYGILPLSREQTRMMGYRLKQTICLPGPGWTGLPSTFCLNHSPKWPRRTPSTDANTQGWQHVPGDDSSLPFVRKILQDSNSNINRGESSAWVIGHQRQPSRNSPKQARSNSNGIGSCWPTPTVMTISLT